MSFNIQCVLFLQKNRMILAKLRISKSAPPWKILEIRSWKRPRQLSFHPSHKPRGSANQLAMTVEIKVQVGMAAKPASGDGRSRGLAGSVEVKRNSKAMMWWWLITYMTIYYYTISIHYGYICIYIHMTIYITIIVVIYDYHYLS